MSRWKRLDQNRAKAKVPNEEDRGEAGPTKFQTLALCANGANLKDRPIRAIMIGWFWLNKRSLARSRWVGLFFFAAFLIDCFNFGLLITHFIQEYD
jgi:hypothetical protein